MDDVVSEFGEGCFIVMIPDSGKVRTKAYTLASLVVYLCEREQCLEYEVNDVVMNGRS